MRQRVSAESTTQSNQTKGLHPVLQHALSHLHVQLDEELTRYRRQKRLAAVPTSPYRTAKPPEMISLTPEEGQVEALPIPQRQPIKVEANPIAKPRPTQPAAPEELSQPAPTSQPIAPLVLPPSLKTIAAGALTKVGNTPSPANDRLVTGNSSDDPYDYLESSEELLKSLSEEEGQVGSLQEGSTSRWPVSLLVGSLLLILLSSATVGFVLVSQQFNASRRSPQSGPDTTARTSNSPAVSGPSASRGQALPPKNPDLSTKEFPELNLNTLGTIPKGSGSPQASPRGTAQVVPPKPGTTPPGTVANAGSSSSGTPTGAQLMNPSATAPTLTLPPKPTRSAENSAPAPNPAPLPRVRVQSAAPLPQSAPVAPAPPPVQSEPRPARMTSPAPEPAKNNTSATPTAPQQEYYYVISNYESDRTLQEAQKSVPGAYVRNFSDGARIQMGAFSDAEKARKMAEQLQQQGISAEVYNPN
ncbi:MAG: SPOR domain-containing protein [Leptolyngbyaceae cyanobacterium bins.59]|nr:SPOR domain-containing protein [Leptolyngbyaceae cyanobacterium bins.59]